MASGAGRVTGGFRFGEFALRAFENMLLRAVGARLPACQLHACSTHRAARRLDGFRGQGRGSVGRWHGLSTACPARGRDPGARVKAHAICAHIVPVTGVDHPAEGLMVPSQLGVVEVCAFQGHHCASRCAGGSVRSRLNAACAHGRASMRATNSHTVSPASEQSGKMAASATSNRDAGLTQMGAERSSALNSRIDWRLEPMEFESRRASVRTQSKSSCRRPGPKTTSICR